MSCCLQESQKKTLRGSKIHCIIMTWFIHLIISSWKASKIHKPWLFHIQPKSIHFTHRFNIHWPTIAEGWRPKLSSTRRPSPQCRRRSELTSSTIQSPKLTSIEKFRHNTSCNIQIPDMYHTNKYIYIYIHIHIHIPIHIHILYIYIVYTYIYVHVHICL